MKRKVTLKELSNLLNVSVSTVSKALNDSPEISVQTRNRIKEFALLNDYIPNASARNLKTKRTKTIGVIIPAILPHFFAKALNGIEEMANEKGYQVIICISNDSLEKEAGLIRTLIESQVDGFIISLARETQATDNINHLQEIVLRDIPLVLFDRISENIICDKISINEELQSELATNELVNSGCKKIIFLSGIAETSVNEQRKEGYLASVRKNELKENIIEFNFENFPHQKLKTIMREKKIDAVLATDELSAVLAMRSILKAGFKIPEDISVIGYTNGTMGENFIPSLTAVDQQAKLQGQLSLEMIIDRLEKNLFKQPIEYKLESSIIHRESTLTGFQPENDLITSKYLK